MSNTNRFDDFEDTGSAPVEGFGCAPQLVPARPDTALTALVTAMALAVCIALTATAMSFGRVNGYDAGGAAAGTATVSDQLPIRRS